MRELRSALEYASVVCDGGLIDARHLPALRAAHGNQSAAARSLGVSRQTIFNRMRKYGLEMRRILDA